MEAQRHSFILVAVFILTATVLTVYRILKPDNRPETLGLAVKHSVFCALAFAANGYLAGYEIEDKRLQALATAPVNFALIMLIAAICTIQARSLGTVDISPRARRLLRHTPRVFLLCFAANLTMSMIWPMPVLDRLGPAPPLYLVNRAFVTVAETFFLAVAAFVSWQAAGPQEPVRRIRVQHAAFLGAQISLVATALNTYAVVLFRVFVSDEALRRSLIEAAFVREFWLAVAAAALYVLGFGLYYAPNERARRITRFSKWRRLRRELDQKLWSVEKDEGSDCLLPMYDRIPVAASELAERAAAEGKAHEFIQEDVRKTLDTFRLFAVVARSTARHPEDSLIGALIRYQESMLRDRDALPVSWSIASSATHRYSYDLSRDPLHEPLKKVWELLRDHRKPRLMSQPQWFQLAVVSAAHAGLLWPEKAASVLDGSAVMDRVLRAYDNAGFAETFLATDLSKQPGAAARGASCG